MQIFTCCHLKQTFTQAAVWLGRFYTPHMGIKYKFYNLMRLAQLNFTADNTGTKN